MSLNRLLMILGAIVVFSGSLVFAAGVMGAALIYALGHRSDTSLPLELGCFGGFVLAAVGMAAIGYGYLQERRNRTD